MGGTLGKIHFPNREDGTANRLFFASGCAQTAAHAIALPEKKLVCLTV
jgi:hypothetical protein